MPSTLLGSALEPSSIVSHDTTGGSKEWDEMALGNMHPVGESFGEIAHSSLKPPTYWSIFSLAEYLEKVLYLLLNGISYSGTKGA